MIFTLYKEFKTIAAPKSTQRSLFESHMQRAIRNTIVVCLLVVDGDFGTNAFCKLESNFYQAYYLSISRKTKRISLLLRKITIKHIQICFCIRLKYLAKYYIIAFIFHNYYDSKEI